MCKINMLPKYRQSFNDFSTQETVAGEASTTQLDNSEDEVESSKTT